MVAKSEETAAFVKATDFVKDELNLSYKEIASQIGISWEKMSMMRAGRRKVREREIEKMVSIYPDTVNFFNIVDTRVDSVKNLKRDAPKDDTNEELKKIIGEMTIEARRMKHTIEMQESEMMEMIDLLREVAIYLDTDGKDRPLSTETAAAFKKIEAILSVKGE